ncbi:MAG: OmpH family outer membrane protein [Candidatus Gastranaerophilales bacterium]|nr:OmpH family outer membrane protein [Candidatus Gastranaerophilales bacterium]
MKKTILTAAIILGLSGMNAAFADTKIAIVDVPAVVAQSQQVQTLKKEEAKKIQDLEKWLKKVNEDVAKQQTEEGKQKLTKKYNEEFAKKKETIAKDYQAKLQMIDKSISDTIAQRAKAKGYDMVVAKGVVLYGGDDITADIKKYVK